MIIDLLLLSFLMSFIPAVRKKAKYPLMMKMTYVVMGTIIMLVGAFFSIFLYPKVQNLYNLANLTYNSSYLYLDLAVIVIGLVMLIVGLNTKNGLIKTNLRFYLSFAFFIFLVWAAFRLLVISTINPVYNLTQQF